MVREAPSAVRSDRQYVRSLMFLFFTEYHGNQHRQICSHLQKSGNFVVLALVSIVTKHVRSTR